MKNIMRLVLFSSLIVSLSLLAGCGPTGYIIHPDQKECTKYGSGLIHCHNKNNAVEVIN